MGARLERNPQVAASCVTVSCRRNVHALVMLHLHRTKADFERALTAFFYSLISILSEATERGLSELAAAIADAVSRAKENAKQALVSEVSLIEETPGIEPSPMTAGDAKPATKFQFCSFLDKKCPGVTTYRRCCLYDG